MGLDTYIYKGWDGEVDSYYDIKTKQRIVVPRQGIEFGRFRKNYVFMEWMEKRLGFEMEDQEYYVLYEEDVKALLEDCELVIDLVNDANKGENFMNYALQFSDELREQIIKIFPQNKWNKEDFDHWDEKSNKPVCVPHLFGMKDFEDVEQIRNTFSNVFDEYVNKVIVYSSM
jgi:hypothetical protein